MARPLKRSPVLAGGAAKRSAVAAPLRPSGRSPASLDLVQSSHSAAYGGVVLSFGADRRLIVNGKGNRYQLQTLGQFDGSPFWGGSFLFATKSALLAKFPSDVGLAAAVADLPEKPFGLCPEFVSGRARQADAFRMSDVGRDAYPAVVAQVDDWRLIVDPDGVTYRLQFVHFIAYSGGSSGWDMWVSSIFSPDLNVISSCIDSLSDARFGAYSQFWASTPDKLSPALSSLPRFASDGSWPALVERPLSVHRQARSKRFR